MAFNDLGLFQACIVISDSNYTEMFTLVRLVNTQIFMTHHFLGMFLAFKYFISCSSITFMFEIFRCATELKKIYVGIFTTYFYLFI